MSKLAVTLIIACTLALPGPASAQTLAKGTAAPETPVDATARAAIRQAAEAGDPGGQYALARMYIDGNGVARDEQQAVLWLRKAAEQGLATAQSDLGGRYAVGKGVDKDEQQAVAWFQKSADQGNPDGQFKLGLMHGMGTGVPKSLEKAHFWWVLASGKGNQNAIKYREMAKKSLSPQQVLAQEAAAVSWMPKN